MCAIIVNAVPAIMLSVIIFAIRLIKSYIVVCLVYVIHINFRRIRNVDNDLTVLACADSIFLIHFAGVCFARIF